MAARHKAARKLIDRRLEKHHTGKYYKIEVKSGSPMETGTRKRVPTGATTPYRGRIS